MWNSNGEQKGKEKRVEREKKGVKGRRGGTVREKTGHGVVFVRTSHPHAHAAGSHLLETYPN